MARIDFVGGAYQSQSVNADAQVCRNLIVEVDESGSGKSRAMLYNRPGLQLFSDTNGLAGRGSYAINGRAFAVTDGTLWEILSTGIPVNLGSVAQDSKPASLSANQNQLLVCSGGKLYCLVLATNVLTEVTSQLNGPPILVGYNDSFFIALLANSAQFQISAPLDGLTWPGLQADIVSVFPDTATSMIIDHRELGIFGQKQSVAYFDSGSTNIFDVIPSGYIEDGAAGPFAVSKLDNTVYYWSSDERGGRMAKKLSGYTPTRISTHAIEVELDSYATISDVICWACQFRGHTLWVSYFPTANKTWVYDVEGGPSGWAEWSYWQDGKDGAFKGMSHMYVFGKHLTQDPTSGKIYEMAMPIASGDGWAFVTDAGNPIRRVRRGPPVSVENERMFGASLQFDMETGLAVSPALTGIAEQTWFILADSTGALWQTTIGNDGILVTLPYTGSQQGQTIFLNDPTNAATFILGITTSGILTQTLVTFDNTKPTQLNLVATDGATLMQVTVTAQGILQTAGVGIVTRNPQAMFRLSKDAGHTWSPERVLDLGGPGEYRKRVIARRLGSWRTAVPELVMTDPVPTRIIDAYLKGSPGYAPQERLSSELRKRA